VSKFKRVSLAGSEELFRPTRPMVVDDADEVITEVLRPRPTEKTFRQFSLSEEEVQILLDAIQQAKYPDRARPKPSLERFEQLDALRDKLQEP
jgi:hypothetical protein